MKIKSKNIVTTAAAAAVILVVTWSLRIPIPATNGGYVNPGDIAIYLTVFILGGPEAILAAAVGSALADLFSGAVVYIAPTFVIKGCMAAAASAILRKKTVNRYGTACILGGAVMTAGYWLFEYFVFGTAYAAGSVPSNIIQWISAAVISIIFYPAARRLAPLIRR